MSKHFSNPSTFRPEPPPLSSLLKWWLKALLMRFLALPKYGQLGLLATVFTGGVVLGWLLLLSTIVPINDLLGLPDVRKLETYAPTSSIEIYDKDDELVTIVQAEEDRQLISIDEVSDNLKKALLASEDNNFYAHDGVDFAGITRALIANLEAGRIVQGGSTITQQLVKNVFFSVENWDTFDRKFQEALMAIEVEQRYDKGEILEIYLNQVYWGNRAYGVERAARRYFAKNAQELNLAESAYLVGLLSAPARHRSQEAFALQRQVINSMVEHGYITSEQAQRAKSKTLTFESADDNFGKFPYYTSTVMSLLRQRYSEDEIRHRGLKVYTTLDQAAQRMAREVLEAGIENAPEGIEQGALVTIDVASGEVRAIVGGVGSFWDNQWNRATNPHTIGSAFKPFVYLTAFREGRLSSESTILDVPFYYEDPTMDEPWVPRNYDGTFRGKINVLQALKASRNIPAIRTGDMVGMKRISDLAGSLGLQGVPHYLSAAIGSHALAPLDVANAYAALARRGKYSKPIIVRRIVDHDRNLLEENQTKFRQIVESAPVDEINHVLQRVVSKGTGWRAKIEDVPIAGKTGTADGSRDVWFTGFTPSTVTVLWGGNDKNEEASSDATGGGVMAGIWKEYMLRYLELRADDPMGEFAPAPPKVVRTIDPMTGLLASRYTMDPEQEILLQGFAPTKSSPPPTPAQVKEYYRRKYMDMAYMRMISAPSLNQQPKPNNQSADSEPRAEAETQQPENEPADRSQEVAREDDASLWDRLRRSFLGRRNAEARSNSEARSTLPRSPYEN